MKRPIHLILHPHTAGGWRWAVHLDDPEPVNLERCINAGHGDTLDDADADGQLVAYSVLSLLTMQLRMPAQILPHRLEADPMVGIDRPNALHL
jgi:hypothetical protein